MRLAVLTLTWGGIAVSLGSIGVATLMPLVVAPVTRDVALVMPARPTPARVVSPLVEDFTRQGVEAPRTRRSLIGSRQEANRGERAVQLAERPAPLPPMIVPTPKAVSPAHRLAPPDMADAVRLVVAAGPNGSTSGAAANGARPGLLNLAGLSPATRSFVRPAPAAVLTASLAPVPAPVDAVSLLEEVSLPRSSVEALAQEIEDLDVPMPTARPKGWDSRMMAQTSRPEMARPETAKSRAARTPAALLAYARPDAGALSDDMPALVRPAPMPSLSRGTAIYDIQAATVYLPSGEKLEAHSGLGALRDDPRYAHKKNRGVTPPHTYNLTMRESLFHGVEAIRLHPVGGEGKIHNRNGLLAHTYMLGPRGDSNGCVSFKDYKRFLAAFKRGEVRRLVVVARLEDDPGSRFSWLFKSKK